MPNRLALALVLTSTSFTALASAQASWHRRYPASVPSGRSNAMTAFDEARGQAVLLFGQGDNVSLSDSWSWDGTSWTQITAARPPFRTSSDMVYDASRQRIVLFGGVNGSRLQDVWEWDGTQWAARTPAAGPAARQDHALAYDRSRGLVVLFGGEDKRSRTPVLPTGCWRSRTGLRSRARSSSSRHSCWNRAATQRRSSSATART